MKGLVLEVREETVILMSPQGQYVERPIPRDPVRVGQTIQVYPAARTAPLRWRQALAFASILMVCLIGVAGYGYTQPFGIVNLDINPSFQITYNAFEQVLDVKSLNDDAGIVLQGQPSFRHQAVPDAVQMLIAAAQEKGFIRAGQQNMIYYAVSERFWATREEQLLTALWNRVPDPGVEITRVLLKGSPEFYRSAVESGESPIPDLLSVVRESEGQDVLFESDIPIQDIGKPVEPEIKPHPETSIPLLPVNPPQEEEKPALSKPVKTELQRKSNEVPENNPANNSEPATTENSAEQPEKPVIEPVLGNPTDSAGSVTTPSPTQGDQQGNKVPSDSTGQDGGSGTPSETTTPSQNSPEGTGSDSGNADSSGTNSPGKKGP